MTVPASSLRQRHPDHESTTVQFHVPAAIDIAAFLDDARAILESGWLSEGPYVRTLERSLRPWVGGGEVVAVSNASNGLVAALSLVGRAGGEVIIPGFTFLATWQAIGWAGMVPVVADVDDRGLLDVAAVEAAITDETVAILPVHLAGLLAPMAALRGVADRHGIALIADAAHAIGAEAGGDVAGSIGDIEVFSLGATKQLAAGEGGFLTIRDPSQVDRARRFALQGREPGSIDPVASGMNLRLDELTAALALRQLDGLRAQLVRRAEIHDRYRDAFAALPVTPLGPRPGERSAHKDQLVLVDEPSDREPLRAALTAAGIGIKPYYDIAVPDLTTFRGRVASAERSRWLAARSFAIPIHARLSDRDVERVIGAFAGFFREHRR